MQEKYFKVSRNKYGFLILFSYIASTTQLMGKMGKTMLFSKGLNNLKIILYSGVVRLAVCDTDQKEITIDETYCWSVDHLGRPIDIYSEADYRMQVSFPQMD